MAGEHVRVRIRRGDWEIEVEGPQDYVDHHVAEAKAEFTAARQLTSRPDVTSTPSDSADAPEASVTLPRLKEFVDQKAPKGHLEIAATLAYWARERESLDALSGDDLARLYKIAELRRPSNPSNVLAKAASLKQWFQRAGAGRYRLTGVGEDYVRFDLPVRK